MKWVSPEQCKQVIILLLAIRWFINPATELQGTYHRLEKNELELEPIQDAQPPSTHPHYDPYVAPATQFQHTYNNVSSVSYGLGEIISQECRIMG